MRGNRVDKNQALVVAGFQLLGASVHSLADAKNGCPDLLVAYRGKWALVEVKDGNKHLTIPQKAWHQRFELTGAPIFIVRDAGDVPAVLEQLREGT